MIDFIKYFKNVNAQKQINKLAKKFKNKKVVIYGAGKYFKNLYDNFDLSKLNVIAICDRKFETNKTANDTSYNALTPDELQEYDFDVILVALYDDIKLINYLKQELLKNTKNEDKKVLPIIEPKQTRNIIDYIRKKDFTDVILKRDLNYKKHLKWLLRLNTDSNYQVIKVENDIITYIGNKIKFLVEAKYPWIAIELFLSDIYKFKFENFDYKKQYTLLDIGSNKGYASLYFAREKWIKNVYAFELVPQTYDFMQKNIKLNPKYKNKIQSFHFGLGKENTEIVIDRLESRDGCNTINPAFIDSYMPEEKGKGVPQKCEIKKASIVLKELIEKNKLDNIIFKIDVEGAEYDIIEDLSENYPEIFSKINILVGDTHLGFDKFFKYLPSEYKIVWKEEHANGTCPFEIINKHKYE